MHEKVLFKIKFKENVSVRKKTKYYEAYPTLASGKRIYQSFDTQEAARIFVNEQIRIKYSSKKPTTQHLVQLNIIEGNSHIKIAQKLIRKWNGSCDEIDVDAANSNVKDDLHANQKTNPTSQEIPKHSSKKRNRRPNTQNPIKTTFTRSSIPGIFRPKKKQRLVCNFIYFIFFILCMRGNYKTIAIFVHKVTFNSKRNSTKTKLVGGQLLKRNEYHSSRNQSELSTELFLPKSMIASILKRTPKQTKRGVKTGYEKRMFPEYNLLDFGAERSFCDSINNSNEIDFEKIMLDPQISCCNDLTIKDLTDCSNQHCDKKLHVTCSGRQKSKKKFCSNCLVQTKMKLSSMILKI
jgi:hypothetical protein